MKEICVFVYTFVVVLALAGTYSYSYAESKSLLDEEDIPIDFLSQINRDWTVEPLTQISGVSTSGEC